MSKKSLILPFLMLLSLAFIGCISNNKSNNIAKVDAHQNQKPNIIFYLADDQDVYDYGCYGNEKVNTSFIFNLIVYLFS